MTTEVAKNKTKQVNVRLTKDQHQRLSTHAKAHGDVPISQIIRIAIVEYLNEKSPSNRPRG
jgi:hypothetical protein